VTEWETVRRILTGESRLEMKILTFAALVAREAGIDSESVVVVGGSAIQVYSESAYVSMDVDLVAVGRRTEIEAVLVRWGFEGNPGLRLWSRDDLGFTLDLFTREYSGDYYKTRVMSTRYGAVRVAGVEDLFLKRLDCVRSGSGNQELDLETAQLLLDNFGDEFDWSYVERIARRQLTSQLVEQLRGRTAR
jgi:hypothetical protein